MSRQFIGSYRKQPREELDYFIDYNKWLVAGETITALTLEIQPETDPPLAKSDTVTTDNVVIGFRLSEGVSGASYQITALATASDGQVVEREFRLAVEEV